MIWAGCGGGGLAIGEPVRFCPVGELVRFWPAGELFDFKPATGFVFDVLLATGFWLIVLKPKEGHQEGIKWQCVAWLSVQSYIESPTIDFRTYFYSKSRLRWNLDCYTGSLKIKLGMLDFSNELYYMLQDVRCTTQQLYKAQDLKVWKTIYVSIYLIQGCIV